MRKEIKQTTILYSKWLVVSTHLNNISQIGPFPQVGVNIKKNWNHHLLKTLKVLDIPSDIKPVLE